MRRRDDDDCLADRWLASYPPFHADAGKLGQEAADKAIYKLIQAKFFITLKMTSLQSQLNNPRL